ncbi:MAG: hypothetical protein KatS3mg035_1208 [Bacteroidia bacterium]|nr:MAG: hypothetical protein KatS3mg035_1208 [Bacteroidia bacterium]
MYLKLLFVFLGLWLYTPKKIPAQRTISPEEIDSNIYIFGRNNSLQFSLTSTDLDPNYPVYNYQYQNQLIQYLQKKPEDLDSLLRLYQVQGYIYNLEGQKNTLTKYKNTIDKILNKNDKDVQGLLHASEYYRLKNNKFLQMNFLDSALKYYPQNLKVQEFYLDYYNENQKYEQSKLFAQQILNTNPQHLNAIYSLIILNFYENAYYGIRNDYSLINQQINNYPDYKPLKILKTYLETLSFILLLTDFEFGEMPFKVWRIPLALKNTSDSLYKAWTNHLPEINHQAAVHSLLSLIKFLEKDTLSARKHFYQAIEKDPFYKPIYYNYFHFWFEMGNYKECIKSAALLTKNIPDTQHSLLLAKAYFFAKNYYQTEEVLFKLLEKKQTEPYVFTALAQYYLKFRKMNQVKKYLELAHQIDPRDPDYNFTAAMYHIALGNKKQAKEHLLTYLEFYEKDATAWDWLKSL